MKTNRNGLVKDFGWLVEDTRERAEKFKLTYVIYTAVYPRRWWWPFRKIRYGRCLLSMLDRIVAAYAATDDITVTE